jgi:sugar/nucleoside kinase (ribokinase family)
MPKIYDVITIGGATRDIMFYTDEATVMPNPVEDVTRQNLVCFEFGAKISIEGSYFTLGGGGNNAAVAFSRLGMKTAAALAIGDDDNGRAVMENLKKKKVDTKFVQKIKNKKTGFSFILTLEKERERTIFFYRGVNEELRITNYELRSFKSKWFYVSSLSNKNWRDILNKVLDRGKLAWNPGINQIKAGKKGLIEFMAHTEVLLINKDEAIELVLSDEKYKNKSADFLNQPRNLLLALSEWGPKITVVTDGGNGAYVYDGKIVYYSPAASVDKKIVDRTGVGDAFGASFTAGLEIYKGDIQKSLRLALVNSASVTTEIGAQNRLLTLKEAEKN